MDVGTLRAEIREGAIAGFLGEVSLAGLGMGEIALKPRASLRSDNSPSHDILWKTGGNWVPAGACWTKKMKSGEEYFSLQFQMAGRDPVNVAAFPDDDDKGKTDIGEATEYTIVFSPISTSRRAAPAGAGDSLAGDGIPF